MRAWTSTKTLGLMVLAISGFGTAPNCGLAASSLAYDTDDISIPVTGFELVDFKAHEDLGWTRKKANTFLKTQISKHNGTFTLRELEILARQLSLQMKQSGLMFSRAIVKEQEVVGQTVSITFEDGLLGEVVVMDAARTKPKLLARPFMPFLQNTAVRDELDEALYRLDRLPGLDVFGFFSFTGTPGLSRLNLRVVEEDTWRAIFHTDNYGSEGTGRERLHASLEMLNMSGWGDKLKLNVGRSYTQPGFFEGYAQYTFPIGPRFQPLSFLISNSDFDLGKGFESLEVFGESTLARVQYDHSLPVGAGSFVGSLGASISKSKVDSEFYSTLFFRESNVNAVDARLTLSNALTTGIGQSVGFGIRAGVFDENSLNEDGNEVANDENFTVFTASYLLQFFHGSDTRPRLSTLDFQFFGSGASLPSVEQTSLGGKYGVKGLPSGYYSADTGMKLHLNYETGLWPRAWPGTVSLLSDFGLGRRNEASTTSFVSPEQTATFASVGLGYRWEKGPFTLGYEFGKVIHADLESESFSVESIEAFNETKPSRHYLSLSYDLGER